MKQKIKYLFLISVFILNITPKYLSDFCSHNYVDRIYNSPKRKSMGKITYETVIIRNDTKFIWNKKRNNMDKSVPLKHLKPELDLFIEDVPIQIHTDEDSEAIKKMKNLGIELNYNKRKKDIEYKFYRIPEKNRIYITDNFQMPYNMTPNGTKKDLNQKFFTEFFPKDWLQRDQKPGIFVQKNYEFIFIVNQLKNEMPIIVYKSLSFPKIWTNYSIAINESLTYYGIFETQGIIYSVAENKNSKERVSQVFRLVDTHYEKILNKTDLEFKTLFGCQPSPQVLSTESQVSTSKSSIQTAEKSTEKTKTSSIRSEKPKTITTTEQITEEITEKTAEEITGKTAEEITGKTAEEITGKTAEEITEKTTETSESIETTENTPKNIITENGDLFLLIIIFTVILLLIVGGIMAFFTFILRKRSSSSHKTVSTAKKTNSKGTDLVSSASIATMNSKTGSKIRSTNVSQLSDNKSNSVMRSQITK